MKKILLLVLPMIILASISNAANRYSVATGLWSATGTWSATSGGAPGASIPAAGDVVFIEGGFTVTVSTANTTNLNSLSIASGSILATTGNRTVTATTITVNGTFLRGGTGAITGTITVGATGIYQHNVDNVTIPTATWNATSTCNVTGVTGTDPVGLGQNFGNFIWNCAGQTGTIGINTTMSIQGNFTVINTNGSSLRLTDNATPRTLTIGGNFIQTGGEFRLNNSTGSGTLNVTGNFSLSGAASIFTLVSGAANSSATITGNVSITGGTLRMTEDVGNGTLNVAGNFSHTAGTITETSAANVGNIIFNGVATQTFTSGGTVSQTINYTVNSGATLQMAATGTVVSGNSFTLSGGAKLNVTSANGINSAGATGNVQTTTRSFSSAANYEFQGSTTGIFTTTPTAATVNNLTVNNAAGVTLSQPIAVAGAFTLTSGAFTTTAVNLLTINDNGTAGAGSNTAYVNGPIRKNGNDAFTFPVGKSGIYAPLSISAPGAVGDAFTAEYFRGTPPDQASRIPQIGNLSTVDYWRLDRPAGTSLVNVTLNWSATSQDPAMPYGASSTVALHSALTPKWASHGRDGGVGAGTVTWNAVASYNEYFAIGVSAAGATGLPVNFANVSAKQTSGGVLVSFSNLTESDLDYYEVERSTDGRNFTSIGKVQPKGNDYGKWDYSFTDAAPASKSYYRIKSVEFSNTTKYSVILKVSSERTANAFVVYPNPVQNKVVTLQANNVAAGAYSVTIVNSNGQQVFAKTMNFQAGSVSQSIELPSSVKPGMYMLRIENAGTRSITSLFIQ